MAASKWFPEFYANMPNLSGKNIVITGCTTGVGLAAAKTVAEKGAKLIMLNRPSKRADAAEETVRSSAAPGAKVLTIACDLTSFKSIRQAADGVRKECGPNGLDVLACNAAVVMGEDKPAADDNPYDIQMATNHLAHFLLTRELMPALEAAAQRTGDARVVGMTSPAADFAASGLDPAYLGKNGGKLPDDYYPSWSRPVLRWILGEDLGSSKRYAQSKLAGCLFIFALDERLRSAGNPAVKALLAHPGLAMTTAGGGPDAPPARSRYQSLRQVFAQTSEDGSMGLLHAMCSPDAASGDYWGPTHGMRGPAAKMTPKPHLQDDTDMQVMWDCSEDAIGGKFTIVPSHEK